MCQTRFEGAGADRHLRHGQQPELPPAITGQPMLHPFWAAGFSFARGHFVILVPYDQHLPMVFQGMFVVKIEVICGGLTNPRRQRFPTYTYVSISIGEEISVGLRAFTHGYDFYARTCAEISCTHVQAEFLLFMPCLIQRLPPLYIHSRTQRLLSHVCHAFVQSQSKPNSQILGKPNPVSICQMASHETTE